MEIIFRKDGLGVLTSPTKENIYAARHKGYHNMTTTSSKLTPQAQAQAIKNKAAELGFEITVRGDILTVSKRIIPGDNQSFADADMSVYSVLELLPRTSPGSDWGTDGGSIGGMTAMNNGRFVMNRSGGSKRVLQALARI
jgi:hypothetical protein